MTPTVEYTFSRAGRTWIQHSISEDQERLLKTGELCAKACEIATSQVYMWVPEKQDWIKEDEDESITVSRSS